ncbi:MAG: cell division protein SepF [Actinomycetota bacterium]|nr:cell division protein SepF [Actinomycetota bacterium]
MASIWRRTMVYLGLVDDDEYEEYEPYDEPTPQVQQTQPHAAPLRRAARAAPEPLDGGGYEPEASGVRTIPRDDGGSMGSPIGSGVKETRAMGGGNDRSGADRGMDRGGPERLGIDRSSMERSGMERGTGAVTVQQRPSVVRPFSQPQAAKVHVVVPVGFNDAQEIGDKLKANQPVIFNLQGVDRDLSRRLIDFSSGLTYGLGGQMERVADQVFLLTPSNVEVSAEEKRRLQERGLYRA